MKTVNLCIKTTRYLNNKHYRNYYVTIPPTVIDALGLQPGDKLSVQQRDQSIVLVRAPNRIILNTQLSKDAVIQVIVRELTNGPKTWSELRSRTRLPFKRVPPKWLSELRTTHGLEITYDTATRCMLWKINKPTTPYEELLAVEELAKISDRSSS